MHRLFTMVSVCPEWLRSLSFNLLQIKFAFPFPDISSNCVLGAPVWPREIIEPVVISAGLPLVLSCEPPPGPPKPETYWMSSCECVLQTTTQRERQREGSPTADTNTPLCCCRLICQTFQLANPDGFPHHAASAAGPQGVHGCERRPVLLQRPLQRLCGRLLLQRSLPIQECHSAEDARGC